MASTRRRSASAIDASCSKRGRDSDCLRSSGGVDNDIRSVSDFIVRYLGEYQRWARPEFVLGESYGGIHTSSERMLAGTAPGEECALESPCVPRPHSGRINGPLTEVCTALSRAILPARASTLQALPMNKLIALVGVCGIVVGIAAAQPTLPPWVAADADFSAFLARFRTGTEAFLNGDPSLWKENASKTERATIMGAWGAYEHTWVEVGPRYDWAASRFKNSGAKMEVEYLSGGVSGDLAYTVAIERSTVHVEGQTQPATMQLRVTHVFGKENGAWKLLHRHADPLMAKTAPDDVLKR